MKKKYYLIKKNIVMLSVFIFAIAHLLLPHPAFGQENDVLITPMPSIPRQIFCGLFYFLDFSCRRDITYIVATGPHLFKSGDSISSSQPKASNVFPVNIQNASINGGNIQILQGSQGSSGPFGDTGAQGSTGATGSTGAAGISVTDPMTTIGDLVYRNGSNVTARLPVGSSG